MRKQAASPGPRGPEAAPDVLRSSVQNVLRAPGRPLDAAQKDDMESWFDADFSDVRLHTGTAARDSAAEGEAQVMSGPRLVSRFVDQFLYLRREFRAGAGDDEHSAGYSVPGRLSG
ncbi:hypothetical protein SBADM41S_01413 [Streptomyces badius]